MAIHQAEHDSTHIGMRSLPPGLWLDDPTERRTGHPPADQATGPPGLPNRPHLRLPGHSRRSRPDARNRGSPTASRPQSRPHPAHQRRKDPPPPQAQRTPLSRRGKRSLARRYWSNPGRLPTPTMLTPDPQTSEAKLAAHTVGEPCPNTLRDPLKGPSPETTTQTLQTQPSYEGKGTET